MAPTEADRLRLHRVARAGKRREQVYQLAGKVSWLFTYAMGIKWIPAQAVRFSMREVVCFTSALCLSWRLYAAAHWHREVADFLTELASEKEHFSSIAEHAGDFL